MKWDIGQLGKQLVIVKEFQGTGERNVELGSQESSQNLVENLVWVPMAKFYQSILNKKRFHVQKKISKLFARDKLEKF